MTHAINILSWSDTAEIAAPIASYGVDFATDTVWQFGCEGSYLSQGVSPAGAIVDNSGNATDCIATVGGIDISVFAFQRSNIPIGSGNRLFTLRGTAPAVVPLSFYVAHPSREGKGVGAAGGQCCEVGGGGASGGGGTAQDAYGISQNTVAALAAIVGVAIPVPLVGTADAYNPAAATASIVLSGSNTTVQSSAGTKQWVPSTKFRNSGKYYIETLYTLTNSSSSSMGFATSAYDANVSLSGHAVTFTGYGGLLVNGTLVISFPLILFSGVTICFAIDFTTQQIWARVGAGGQWNANALANPATNVGGVSIATILSSPLAPLAFIFAGGAESYTTNFGNSAFVGSPPGGFMAGWPQ